MNIQSVNDKAFEVYGRVVDGYDYAELLATLEKCSEKPADSVIYVPGCAELEATPAYRIFRSTAMAVCRSRLVTVMEQIPS